MKLKMLSLFARINRCALCVALVLGIFAESGIHHAAAQSMPPRAAGKGNWFPNVDVRVTDRAAALDVAGKNASLLQSQARVQTVDLNKAISDFKARTPGAEATVSAVTGAVEVVRSNGTFLTGLANGVSGADIVRNFITNNSALYGLSAQEIDQLHFIGESVSKGSGLRMVRVEQTANGRPIFQSETRFTMDRDGRLVRSVGLMVPNATIAAAPLVGLISAQEALKSAMGSVGIALDASQMTVSKQAADGMSAELAANNEAVPGNVHSEIVYFAIAPGTLVPAWSQIAYTSGRADWYILVDARTGQVLWRKNIRDYASTQEARFRVYVQPDGVTPADNPAPHSPTDVTPGAGTQFPGISPTIVSMSLARDNTASPNGWIDDGGTTTTGNNVDAYLDRVGGAGETNVPDIGALDSNGRPVGNPDTNSNNRDFLGTSPRDFETGFLPPPQGGDPETGQTCTGSPDATFNSFRRGAVTQLFYLTNWYHDKLFSLGFDEAAGNFQQTNFSGFGLSNDRVLAEAEDSGDVNNANFSTPPDGQSGRMQMYRFTGPDIDRDGDLDAEVVLHELTHGVSNRLIGNAAGLVWDPGAGMGEGWSDFYSLSLLNNTNSDDPNGKYSEGSYATYKLTSGYTDNYLFGIRRFPYSTDNTVNPLTWADVDDYTNNLSGGIAASPINFNSSGAQEVHNVGEVWCLSLWEVRSRIIADAAGANGDVPTGNHTMLQLVTDALKLTPINPSYTDARDAILDADAATDSSANEESIWSGFADRGLGYGAKTSTVVGTGLVASHQGIVESFSPPYLDVQSVTIDDSSGNNNGAIDPGEDVKIVVKLKNPWRNTSKGVASATALLSTTNGDATITDANSTYPAIAAQGNANGDSFAFSVAGTATAGEALKFTINVTSSLGTHAVDFTLRVGTPSGTGAPITYTRTPSPALSIPDNSPRGVVDSMNITDDFVISKLQFRVDSLTHTFISDVTVGFKAPNGYGIDIIGLTGFGTADGGSGDNFTNVLIDDSSTNNLIAATAVAHSPGYTGTWMPEFKSPSWPIIYDANATPDSGAELDKMDGASTKGTWQVLVSDESHNDTGTLNSWSLIVTPQAYTVQSIVPATASLGDRVWSDANSNGVQDSGEPGLNGVNVQLYDSSMNLLSTTATAGDGNYTFAALPAGSYTVRVVSGTLPSGATPTYDLDGISSANQATISVGDGQTRTDVDFGYHVTAAPTPTPPPHHHKKKHHHKKHHRQGGG